MPYKIKKQRIKLTKSEQKSIEKAFHKSRKFEIGNKEPRRIAMAFKKLLDVSGRRIIKRKLK